MTLELYWDRNGWPRPVPSAETVERYRQNLRARAAAPPPVHLRDLYEYPVPRLGPDGACAWGDALADEPYRLTERLGPPRPDLTARLLALQALVGRVADITGAEWLGIYTVCGRAEGGRTLVKLAYRGVPSRAEFPLTAEYAARSNNSAVALSGRGRVIADVSAHLAAGGPYYACDGRVQAEACLPLLSLAGDVVGLLDAESHQPGFFGPGLPDTPVAAALPPVLAPLLALALEAPAWLA